MSQEVLLSQMTSKHAALSAERENTGPVELDVPISTTSRPDLHRPDNLCVIVTGQAVDGVHKTSFDTITTEVASVVWPQTEK